MLGDGALSDTSSSGPTRPHLRDEVQCSGLYVE